MAEGETLTEGSMVKGSDGGSETPFNGFSTGRENKRHTIARSRGYTPVRSELLSNFTTQLDKDRNNSSEDVLQKVGLDPQRVKDIWRQNAPKNEHELYVQRNLETINTLESFRPGISKVLFEEFGIENFGRYPADVLVKQYDNRDNKDLQYGVMVMNKSDYNGAFHNRGGLYDSLANQLENLGYGLRIIEANTKKDMFEILDNLNTRYGNEHKMEFAVIGGHGERTGITMGKPLSNFKRFFHYVANMFNLSTQYEMRRRDINKPLFQRIKGYFKENPTWLLWSCSTGKDRGVGQKISEELGAKVVASEFSVPPQSIVITKDSEGRLNFDNTTFVDPRYYKRYDPSYLMKSVKAKLFNRGKVAA